MHFLFSRVACKKEEPKTMQELSAPCGQHIPFNVHRVEGKWTNIPSLSTLKQVSDFGTVSICLFLLCILSLTYIYFFQHSYTRVVINFLFYDNMSIERNAKKRLKSFLLTQILVVSTQVCSQYFPSKYKPFIVQLCTVNTFSFWP